MNKFGYLALSFTLLSASTALASFNPAQDECKNQQAHYYASHWDNIRTEFASLTGYVRQLERNQFINLVGPSLQEIKKIKTPGSCASELYEAELNRTQTNYKEYVALVEKLIFSTPTASHQSIFETLFQGRLVELTELRDLIKLLPSCFGLYAYPKTELECDQISILERMGGIVKYYPDRDNDKRLKIVQEFVARVIQPRIIRQDEASREAQLAALEQARRDEQVRQAQLAQEDAKKLEEERRADADFKAHLVAQEKAQEAERVRKLEQERLRQAEAQRQELADKKAATLGLPTDILNKVLSLVPYDPVMEAKPVSIDKFALTQEYYTKVLGGKTQFQNEEEVVNFGPLLSFHTTKRTNNWSLEEMLDYMNKNYGLFPKGFVRPYTHTFDIGWEYKAKDAMKQLKEHYDDYKASFMKPRTDGVNLYLRNVCKAWMRVMDSRHAKLQSAFQIRGISGEKWPVFLNTALANKSLGIRPAYKEAVRAVLDYFKGNNRLKLAQRLQTLLQDKPILAIDLFNMLNQAITRQQDPLPLLEDK